MSTGTSSIFFLRNFQGARMVFIGRPTFYGLANGGQQGVENVLEILKREFVNTAKLCGAANMAGIRPEMVIPANSAIPVKGK